MTGDSKLVPTAYLSSTALTPVQDSTFMEAPSSRLQRRPAAPRSQTVSELFTRMVRRMGDRTAFRFIQAKEGDQSGEERADVEVPFTRRFSVISYSWKRYSEEAKKFAKALIALGVQPHEVATIQGANSPQWMFANLGTILAGGVSAGVYPTNGRELCEYIVGSSGAKVAFVEDENQLKKYEGIASTALKCIVVWKKITKSVGPFHVPVVSLEDFLRAGEGVPDGVLEERMQAQDSGHPCSLVYTSGTTGNPKAAVVTHENLAWTASTGARRFSLNPDHCGISFLPLSHIAPMQLDCIVPLVTGHSVDIAPSDVLKGTNLRTHMVHTRPTYFLGVPRVWEKFKEAIEAKVAATSFFKRKLFEITTSIARALSPDYNRLTVKEEFIGLSILERIRYVFEKGILLLLEKAVLTPIKVALGLDRCKIAASGAGAMDQTVRDFFAGLNLHILDLYGMSESSGPACVPDGSTPPGSCGRALPGTVIRILNPDARGEGEILLRGPNVIPEYWGDRVATEQTLDAERFLHTGDKGRLDETGNLFITGRIKELIKTSGGENIPPLRIEDRIKTQLPIVSQAVLIGNNRNFLTCLLTLKTEVDESGSPTERLAPDVIATLQEIGSVVTTLREAADDRRVQEFLMQGIERANQQADSRAQHVQKITVLHEEISVANGLLTPTLKMKRSLIEQRYRREICEMYSAPVGL